MRLGRTPAVMVCGVVLVASATPLGSARAQDDPVPALVSKNLKLPPGALAGKQRSLDILGPRAEEKEARVRDLEARAPKTFKLAFRMQSKIKDHLFSVRFVGAERKRQLISFATSGSHPAVLITLAEPTGVFEMEVVKVDDVQLKMKTGTKTVPMFSEPTPTHRAAIAELAAAREEAADARRGVEAVERLKAALEPEAQKFHDASIAALGGDCAEGTALAGAPPPWGQSVGCVRVEGEALTRHGPWSYWSEDVVDEGETATSREWGQYADGKKVGVWTLDDGTTGHRVRTAFADGVALDTSFLFEPMTDGACKSRRKRQRVLAAAAATAARLPKEAGWDQLVADAVRADLLGRSACTTLVIDLAESILDHDDGRAAGRVSDRLIVDHVQSIAEADKAAAWKIVNGKRFPERLRSAVGDVEPDDLKRKRRQRELKAERKEFGRWTRYADRLLDLHCKLRKEEYEASAKVWTLSHECDGPKNYRRCSYKRRQAVHAKINDVEAARRAKRAKRDEEIRLVGEEMLYEATRAGEQGTAVRAGGWVLKMANATCPMRDPTGKIMFGQ